MRVFLIHGMGRTPLSMAILKGRLEKAGHQVTLFGYLVTTESLTAIGERFITTVRESLAQDRETPDAPAGGWAVVGHSLGNIVARWASDRLPGGFERFVMLAPPNQPPAIARALERNWLFRLLTRDAGAKLADPSFYDELPIPEVPMLIVAGTWGPRRRWLPMGERPNDCLVAVEETRLGDTPVVEVHAAHTFLMNRRDVFEIIDRFLAEPEVNPIASSRTMIPEAS